MLIYTRRCLKNRLVGYNVYFCWQEMKSDCHVQTPKVVATYISCWQEMKSECCIPQVVTSSTYISIHQLFNFFNFFNFNSSIFSRMPTCFSSDFCDICETQWPFGEGCTRSRKGVQYCDICIEWWWMVDTQTIVLRNEAVKIISRWWMVQRLKISKWINHVPKMFHH